MKFSIYLPTHNRYELVRLCLTSLRNQTFGNFEVLLHDNGSQVSVEPLMAEFGDERFHFTRSYPATDFCDNGEAALSRATGDVFMFLSDDDALVPRALEIVARTMDRNPTVRFLTTGLSFYDHENHLGQMRRIHTGRLTAENGPQQALGYANGSTAIGAKLSVTLPPEAHPSGIFIRMDLLKTTREKQGRIFVKPFGDVGYLGCLMDVEACHHLDLPLAVIGDSLVRETSGAKKGQRRRLDRYRDDLQVSPLKGITFINLALESHLKVLTARGHERLLDLRIRPEFFRTHLREIWGDHPKDLRTFVDLLESLPLFARSLVQFFSFSQVVRNVRSLPWVHRLVLMVRRVKAENPTPEAPSTGPAPVRYADISDYANGIRIVEGDLNA